MWTPSDKDPVSDAPPGSSLSRRGPGLLSKRPPGMHIMPQYGCGETELPSAARQLGWGRHRTCPLKNGDQKPGESQKVAARRRRRFSRVAAPDDERRHSFQNENLRIRTPSSAAPTERPPSSAPRGLRNHASGSLGARGPSEDRPPPKGLRGRVQWETVWRAKNTHPCSKIHRE